MIQRTHTYSGGAKLLRLISAFFLAMIAGIVLLGSGPIFSSYSLIQDEGTGLTRQQTLNFIGAGVNCANSSSPARTDCTVSGVANTNYRQTFTNQTTVILTHNLNTLAVIVACYDASGTPLEIIPNTSNITDVNNFTVTFSIAQSGSCVVNGATSTTLAAASYHYQYISGGVLAGTTAPFLGSFNANAASFLTANAPVAGVGTGPAMTTLAAGGSTALLQFALPSTWDGSAITLDVDGTYDVSTAAGTIIFRAYSVDITTGGNAQVVTWSSPSATATVNAVNNAFPLFPPQRWSLSVPTSGLTAGHFIYIVIARPSGDTFTANSYVFGANLGIKY